MKIKDSEPGYSYQEIRKQRDKKLQSRVFNSTDRTGLRIIARIRTDFPSKFGIPRQSGMIDTLKAKIVFEPEYRNSDAVRGLDGFSHIWLIWGFSEAFRPVWSPLVHPPRLGGNRKMGVFATRSPNRPNSLGLSSVRLEGIVLEAEHGPVLHVSGADLMDNTPIYDIKPYLSFTDSHPQATGGFADSYRQYSLKVKFPEQWLEMIPREKREALAGVLSHDPRPSYQDNPDRVYGVEFAGFDIRFQVKNQILTVIEVVVL